MEKLLQSMSAIWNEAECNLQEIRTLESISKKYHEDQKECRCVAMEMKTGQPHATDQVQRKCHEAQGVRVIAAMFRALAALQTLMVQNHVQNDSEKTSSNQYGKLSLYGKLSQYGNVSHSGKLNQYVKLKRETEPIREMSHYGKLSQYGKQDQYGKVSHYGKLNQYVKLKRETEPIRVTRPIRESEPLRET
ncbi:hypothetical protein MAR_015987 [Mya arenaria]|uniref:Uncharacterized protein n=1 Tax=Mya arenaria TaxID=6604 RepID=A0ABY7FMV8_MYAAR|nr:hypothetical protein MAR_015987 [Mya arenaria]